jgi:hypothetical protein
MAVLTAVPVDGVVGAAVPPPPPPQPAMVSDASSAVLQRNNEDFIIFPSFSTVYAHESRHWPLKSLVTKLYMDFTNWVEQSYTPIR